jgi:hypothetical protein
LLALVPGNTQQCFMPAPLQPIEVQHALAALTVKAKWQINLNGQRTKVVRKSDNEYFVYHNGHWVNTEANAIDAAKLVFALFQVT